MIQRSLISSFFLLLIAGFAKATTLGIKLLILAGCGIAGMYMIHLLAQDYNQYQTLNRPGRSVSGGLVKRSVADYVTYKPPFRFFDFENSTSSGDLMKDIKEAEKHSRRNELLTLDRILQFDPTGCARRYVCMISTKSSKKLSTSEKNIIQMLRSLRGKTKPDSVGLTAFKFALDLGRRTKDAQACAEEYPKCIFTISQMLKLIGIF